MRYTRVQQHGSLRVHFIIIFLIHFREKSFQGIDWNFNDAWKALNGIKSAGTNENWLLLLKSAKDLNGCVVRDITNLILWRVQNSTII